MGPHPYGSLTILRDRNIDLGSAPFFELVHGEARGCRIETIETIEGADPQSTGMIDKQLGHIVVAQTKWIGWAVPEGLQLSGLRIVTGQAQATGTNPKKTRSIFDNGSGARTDSWSPGP